MVPKGSFLLRRLYQDLTYIKNSYFNQTSCHIHTIKYRRGRIGRRVACSPIYSLVNDLYVLSIV